MLLSQAAPQPHCARHHTPPSPTTQGRGRHEHRRDRSRFSDLPFEERRVVLEGPPAPRRTGPAFERRAARAPPQHHRVSRPALKLLRHRSSLDPDSGNIKPKLNPGYKTDALHRPGRYFEDTTTSDSGADPAAHAPSHSGGTCRDWDTDPDDPRVERRLPLLGAPDRRTPGRPPAQEREVVVPRGRPPLWEGAGGRPVPLDYNLAHWPSLSPAVLPPPTGAGLLDWHCRFSAILLFWITSPPLFWLAWKLARMVLPFATMRE